MSGLPRKYKEFREMFLKDVEAIIKPYGFEYEDRDEYYGSDFQSSQETRDFLDLYYKPMPYGKLYIELRSSGRLSEYRIIASAKPAIQEVANIEQAVYGEKGIRHTYNVPRWEEGYYGTAYNLTPSSGMVRNIEQYQKKLEEIKLNLPLSISLLTPTEILMQPDAKLRKLVKTQEDIEKLLRNIVLRDPQGDRLGYWLILSKIGNEILYQELAQQYVETHDKVIKEVWGQDITKLKEFLNTYTVGSLA